MAALLCALGACAEAPPATKVAVAPAVTTVRDEPPAAPVDAAISNAPRAISVGSDAEAAPSADADPTPTDDGATSESDRAKPPDPLGGVFTLDDATRGLPKKGKLVASIVTDKGTLRCQLFEDRAPQTVASFVGLARGVRPWLTPAGRWETRPAYDDTTFHRVIRDFMIQGGDPWGDGTGEPGFLTPDERWKGAVHDRAGLLCIANKGPDTNGMQFFITDGAAPHLDGSPNAYTIFGECSPIVLVHELARVPVTGTKPVRPLRIRKIAVGRREK